MSKVFFDIKVITEWVPQGRTINKRDYLQVVTVLEERVRRIRTESWRKRLLNIMDILDNAPAHIICIVCKAVSGQKSKYNAPTPIDGSRGARGCAPPGFEVLIQLYYI